MNTKVRATLASDFLEHFQAVSFSVQYPRGMALIEQGAFVEQVSVVEEDVLKTAQLTESGAEIIIGLVLPGSITGLTSVILRERSPVSVITVTRVRMVHIPARVFLQRLEQAGLFACQVYKSLCSEYNCLLSSLADAKGMTARSRLLTVFHTLANAVGAVDREEDARSLLRHWELAQLVGVTPEHLSRILRDLNIRKRTTAQGRSPEQTDACLAGTAIIKR